MLRVYLDTSVISALERRDQSIEEMSALDWLLRNGDQHGLVLVTSRESIREIGRTPDEKTREALTVIYAKVEVVKEDHVILGCSTYSDQWTCFSIPLVSDVIAPAIFSELGQIGLTGSDQKHLMYAIHNKCDVFLTLDRKDFIEQGRRAQIEAAYPSIKVRTPKELRIEIIK